MSRRWRRALAAMLAVGLLSVSSAPAAEALTAGELRVEDEASWHADRDFHFEWLPLPPPGQPTDAVYRLYNSQGAEVRALMRPLDEMLEPFWVPPLPGIYTLEAWLQDGAGRHGPHSSATLRFDDGAPPAPTLQPPPGWVLGVETATLGIDPPASSVPRSGLRGYAISVDRGGGSSPCASPTRCAAGEVDLAGAGGGSISLGILPRESPMSERSRSQVPASPLRCPPPRSGSTAAHPSSRCTALRPAGATDRCR